MEGYCGISQEAKLCKTMPQEEGDTIREYKGMHEENFMSSRSREDKECKRKRQKEVDEEVNKDVGEKGKRVREREVDEAVVKRKCVNPVSVEASDIFSQGEMSGCDSECGSVAVSVVPVLAGVGVSALSVVTVVFEDVLSDTEWDFVEPQSFSLSPRSVISLVWKTRKT